jgi:hypothetical protein
MRSWLEIWLPNCEAQQVLQMWSRELEWLLAAGGQAGETIVGYYGTVLWVGWKIFHLLGGAGRQSVYRLSSYNDRCVGYE